jgi:hypothetical protein
VRAEPAFSEQGCLTSGQSAADVPEVWRQDRPWKEIRIVVC